MTTKFYTVYNPVTQEWEFLLHRNNAKEMPNLFKAMTKTSEKVSKQTKIFYCTSNQKKWITAYSWYDIILISIINISRNMI
jgi:hypothetical protein